MEKNVKQKALDIIQSYEGEKLRIMEVCGTHTHEIFRLGIRKILPEQIELISGPGCPVCVTPVGFIDEAIALALEHQAVVCTFGDLVRVPGTRSSLSEARAKGANVKINPIIKNHIFSFFIQLPTSYIKYTIFFLKLLQKFIVNCKKLLYNYI